MFSNTATTHLMKTKESPLTNTNKIDLLHDNDFVEEVFYCPVSGAPNVLCLLDKSFHIKLTMSRS